MRSVQFSVVAILMSFGAVVLGARPAQAAICCSNAKCQVENPPAMCNWCTPTCSEDEQSEAPRVVYDEVESICYVTGEPASEEDGERSGCESAEAK